MAPLLRTGAYVVDVGSGAGLPGIVLAIARPDVAMVLLEPLARRTSFLEEAVAGLGLADRVSVVRGRAEEVAARPEMFHVKPADVVTARAVAPLDRLTAWCLPLAAVGGRLLAMKGSSASEEVASHADAITRMGGGVPTVRECGSELLESATTVVEIIRERAVGQPTSGSRQRPGRRSRPR
jgi:16S rRNA (guanine527-N7)-methyltransferase